MKGGAAFLALLSTALHAAGGDGLPKRPQPPPAKAVRALQRQLEEKDAKRREEASAALVSIAMDFPGEVLPGLPVDAADPDVRKLARSMRSAFEILGERGVVGKFTDDEFNVAMDVLTGERRRAVERLLASKTNRTRQAAMEAVYKRGWKDLAPIAAERAVADTDSVVRSCAFGILESFGDPSHLRAVLLGLRDGDTTIRTCARRAFERLKEAPQASQELERLLADGDFWIRMQAAETLGKSKDRLRVPALLARFDGERNDDVRRALFAAIDRLVGGDVWRAEGVPAEVQAARDWWERNRKKFR